MSGRYHVLPAAFRHLDEQAADLAQEASLQVALRFYDAADESRMIRPATPAEGTSRSANFAMLDNLSLRGTGSWRP